MHNLSLNPCDGFLLKVSCSRPPIAFVVAPSQWICCLSVSLHISLRALAKLHEAMKCKTRSMESVFRNHKLSENNALRCFCIRCLNPSRPFFELTYWSSYRYISLFNCIVTPSGQLCHSPMSQIIYWAWQGFSLALFFSPFSILGVRGILKCVLFSYPARGKMAELQARRESRRFRNTYKWGAFAVSPCRHGSRLVLRQGFVIGIESIAHLYCAPS